MKNILICLLSVLLISGCAGMDDGRKNKDVIKEEVAEVVAQEALIVVLETTQGNIEFKLFPEIAPKACENFTTLIKEGYYDGIIFHRIIKGFMIQGGDPTGTGRGGQSKWGIPFEDEVTRTVTFNKPYLLAMANSGPATNGSQFFITTKPTTWLNMKHTIFGEVIGGQDIVRKLDSVPTDTRDKPLTPQKIISSKVK